MDFVNQSSYQADAFWGPSDANNFGVCVIAKATYDCSNGRMIQTQDNPWPVHFHLVETPYGCFPPENNPYPKTRTDIVVCGQARSPNALPVQRMQVRVEVGDFTYAVEVFGDRFWDEEGECSTDPEYFTAIPLTLDYAFGGKIASEWGDLPNPYNPVGKGWYPDREQMDKFTKAPLPNLEDPSKLVQKWDDQPVPTAPCPYTWSGGGLFLDIPNNPLKPDRFLKINGNHLGLAHPDLMLSKFPLNVGEKIRVEGICHEGPLTASVPDFKASAEVSCDDRKTHIPFKLDTVIIQGEENRVVFRWRGAAVFSIQPREIRTVTLKDNNDSAGDNGRA